MTIKSDPGYLYPVDGIQLAAVSAGLRNIDKPDLVLIQLDTGSISSATFTQNKFCAAPVLVAKEHIKNTSPKYFLINAANANAGTGEKGLADARQCCQQLSVIAACKAEQVLPFSTGVIGEYLSTEKIVNALPKLVDELDRTAWLAAAHGIMTTDTVPKADSCTLEYKGKTITITGIAKGAGMIRPNMATMLSFIATDAQIEPALLETLHKAAVQKSFNRITVDGDTSTNDACVLVATGASSVPINEQDADFARFAEKLYQLYENLAKAIVYDAEGATKFITITVVNAYSEQESESVAYTIAHSPLVKTALYASDANWGRILAAVGRAEFDPSIDVDVDLITISLNGVNIVSAGEKDHAYTESIGSKIMQQTEINIHVDLNRGSAEHTIWTSDLSHDYVSINADYRS